MAAAARNSLCLSLLMPHRRAQRTSLHKAINPSFRIIRSSFSPRSSDFVQSDSMQSADKGMVNLYQAFSYAARVLEPVASMLNSHATLHYLNALIVDDSFRLS